MFDKKDLRAKTEALLEPIRSYATSLKAAEINSNIFSSSPVMASDYASLSLLINAVIVKIVPVADLEKELKAILTGWPDDQILALAIEITGSRLLICDDWLQGEAAKYLSSKGADLSKYAKINAEHMAAIAAEEEFFKKELAVEEPYQAPQAKDAGIKDVLSDEAPVKSGSDFDLQAEKRKMLDLLKGGLMPLISSNDNRLVDECNYSFARVWLEDDKFRLEAPATLIDNKERIPSLKIENAGRVQSLTVATLLKDFVKKYSLNGFNELNLAEYMSSSSMNAVSLDDKKTILSILKLYRNIGELESKAAADEEDFDDVHIFPYRERSVAGVGFVSAAPSRPAVYLDLEQSARPKTAMPSEKSVAPSPRPSFPAKPAIVSQPRTAELEEMLKNYAPASLEYKAISEEILRLEKAAAKKALSR